MDRNALKAAAYSALWTFVAMFGVTLLGWLNDVGQWATDAGEDRGTFPDLSVLGGGALAAAAAALTFIVAFVVRQAQASGVVPGAPPSYPEP